MEGNYERLVLLPVEFHDEMKAVQMVDEAETTVQGCGGIVFDALAPGEIESATWVEANHFAVSVTLKRRDKPVWVD